MTLLGAFISDLTDGSWIPPAFDCSIAGLGVWLAGLGVQRGLSGWQGGGNEARRQWARNLADASFDGLLIHRDGTILQMNRALVRMLGYRETELVGTDFCNLAHPSQLAELRIELEAPRPETVEFTLLHADHSERFVEMASHALEFDGQPVTVTAIRNLTALRAIETHLMHHDALTGLSNRAQFTDKVQEALTRNNVAGGTTAVLTLQVSELQAINEQLGRGVGDNLMRQIANRLIAMAHQSDTVARLSADKFAIVQPHDGGPTRTASLISQIESSMREPFNVIGNTVKADMAIGVAVHPEHATNAEGLINASEFAMTEARKSGGTRMFSPAEAAAAGFRAAAEAKGKGNATNDTRTLNMEEQRLAQDLRVGLSRGEFSLEYQPVFATKYLSIAGFEALARWRHPKDGPISPAKFIPLADAAGISHALGNFIMETACMEAVRCKTPSIAINLSPMQFRDPKLFGRMRDILLKTGLAPSRLEVQVTEGMLVRDPAMSSAVLREIKALGVVITLDDFGTGFTPLTTLSEFPFKRIKIDKRFIQLLGEDSNAQAVVMAIITLARSLHIEVMAEGVETEAQLNFVQAKGCNFVQGYHLGRPTPQPSTLTAVKRG